MSRIAVQTVVRTGTVKLLTDFRASLGSQLQIYRARPRQLKPPTAYVEGITETLADITIEERQRNPRVSIRCVWGRFDDGDAVDQRDAFVDAFLDFVVDRPHAFGPNTICSAVAVADAPAFDFEGESYLSSVIVLEGMAAT